MWFELISNNYNTIGLRWKKSKQKNDNKSIVLYFHIHNNFPRRVRMFEQINTLNKLIEIVEWSSIPEKKYIKRN